MIRRPKYHRHRPLAAALTVAVLLLQAALLLAFLIDPSDPPRSGSLPQAIWALFHRPAFYPLVLLTALGPPATWVACAVRGPHRRPLLAAWAVFLPALIVLHGHRIAVMFKILWRVMW